LPCLAYVLRHQSGGTVLIDTGMHADAASDLRKDFGRPMSFLLRALKPSSAPFDAQLRAVGVDPEGVERVIMTHLHVDHTSGMRLLPNARFICSRDEWDTAHSAHAGARGFVSHHLPDATRMELVDFASAGEPFGPFRRAIDLFGDGSVRLISTPGHTAGHQSVLVATEEGSVLVVGDAAYTVRSIREQILPLLTDDDAAYRRTLAELKTFADANPGVLLVPSHDPVAWRELDVRQRPEAATRG
jgi:glyoxylase-like metal-dependent hydrolase (beta-lactamase superfamily II)